MSEENGSECEVTFKFDSDEERDYFIGWFLDGGGDYDFREAGEDEGYVFRTRYVQPSTIYVVDEGEDDE